MHRGHASHLTNSVRNLETFRFTLDEYQGLITSNLCTGKSACQTTSIYLDGIIYNNSLEQLVTGFAEAGPSYVDHLEGSFVLFLLRGSEFYILTDKVNSRKAFYLALRGQWHITNDIDQLPVSECELNLDAIACYLANGILLNDLTLFKSVHSATRACIHRFQGNQIDIDCYWRCRFSYSDSFVKHQNDHQMQLQSLLIEAVRLRADAVGAVNVSLSAGYDVRGILGILCDQLQQKNVRCFSYALHDDPAASTDAGSARLLAKLCGYEHDIVRSYHGDFVDHLANNVKYGKCLANFCDELDAWLSLAMSEECLEIFAGDQCFGGADIELTTDAAILDSIGITGANGIAWLKGRIPPATHASLVQRLDQLMQQLIRRSASHSNPYDKRDFLRLDQRIGQFMMPWRQYLCGRAGVIHNPFLDGRILNFMTQVPPHLRRGKRFYRRAISQLLPALFSVRLAKQAGYKTDWSREISKNQQQLTELILSTDSRLDSVIDKNDLVRMLHDQGKRLTRTQALLARSISFLCKRSKTFNRLIASVAIAPVGPRGRAVPPFRLVLRLLMLRFYLVCPKHATRKPHKTAPLPAFDDIE